MLALPRASGALTSPRWAAAPVKRDLPLALPCLPPRRPVVAPQLGVPRPAVGALLRLLGGAALDPAAGVPRYAALRRSSSDDRLRA